MGVVLNCSSRVIFKKNPEIKVKKQIVKTQLNGFDVGILHEKSDMHRLLSMTLGIKQPENFKPVIRRFRMPRLTQIQRNQAIGRLEAGESALHVARQFNVHISTIYRLQERYNTTQTTDDRPRSGRPRVTTPRQDRQITRHHQRDPFRPDSQTARDTLGTHNRPISSDTVMRRLRSANLQCRRPARRPILLPRHRQAQLASMGSRSLKPAAT